MRLKHEKIFRLLISITEFKNDKFYNYNYFDLFYWEHRMTLWHSLIVLESDMAYETHILYNNRVLLSKMLTAPYEVRESSEPFIKMIRDTWPELLNLPSNGKYISNNLYINSMHLSVKIKGSVPNSGEIKI